MKPEDHRTGLQESTTAIDEAIEHGVAGRQRSIGFHTSAAAVDMLEMLLHQHKIIDPGAMLKHEWFSSEKRAEKMLHVDFPRKAEIVRLLARIEAKRNPLCYGKQQPESAIRAVLDDFTKLQQVMEEVLHETL